jgi:hypothetical protein
MHRRWLLGIIVLTGSLSLWLNWFIHPNYLTTLCSEVDVNNACTYFWSQIIDGGFNFGFGLKAVIITSIIFLFLSARAFRWWKWFALVAIPIGVWDIITTKSGNYFPGSPDVASNIDGEIFLGISILIAIIATIYDFFEKRKKGNK